LSKLRRRLEFQAAIALGHVPPRSRRDLTHPDAEVLSTSAIEHSMIGSSWRENEARATRPKSSRRVRWSIRRIYAWTLTGNRLPWNAPTRRCHLQGARCLRLVRLPGRTPATEGAAVRKVRARDTREWSSGTSVSLPAPV